MGDVGFVLGLQNRGAEGNPFVSLTRSDPL